ncbi:MAG: RNA methyltransferase [Cyanobacteriota bacterium]|nr:RNA methyltransferase [Cyanobacteriota bacterium]
MIVTSTKNEWIRQLRQLQQGKGRREQGAFLVEGTHLLQEALTTHWPLAAVCYTPAWAKRCSILIADIPQSSRQQLVSEAVLGFLATTETPDGVVAVAQHRDHPQPDPLPLSMGLALETLQDPGNLGSLIRVAVAAGANQIWLSRDSVDPENPKVLRASAGQWFRLCPQVCADLPQLIESYQQQQVQVLATSADETGIPFWQVDFTRPSLLLLGNEGAGLSPALLKMADQQVRIPMAGGVESLNLAMAGGLLLYEAKRQRWQQSRG